MFHKDENVTISEGSILVSDVHYTKDRDIFYYFLKDIYDGVIETKQLILLGDIFDALFAPIDSLVKRESKVIKLLNQLSQKIDIIYFEGNHDFCLKELFPSVKVIPLEQQPLQINSNNQLIYLAHGDYGLNLSYKIYTFLIRNRFVLNILNFVNKISLDFLVKKLDAYLQQKDNCHKFDGFEEYISNKINSLSIEKRATFIEGHHHQGKNINISEINYLNLDAFACNQRFYSVQFDEELLTLSVNSFRHSNK